jgi:hypothetical protein
MNPKGGGDGEEPWLPSKFDNLQEPPPTAPLEDRPEPEMELQGTERPPDDYPPDVLPSRRMSKEAHFHFKEEDV